MHLSGPALFAFAFRFVFTGFYTVLGASVPTSAAAGSVHTDAHAVTCQSFSISWTGGTAPFRLELQNTAAPNPPILLLTQTASTYVWTPDVPAGTTVRLQVNDSSGTLAQNSTFNVQAGTDTSCVVQPSSSATSTAGVSSATSTAGVSSVNSASGTSSVHGSSAITPSTTPATGIVKASSGNDLLLVAIVVPIVLVLVIVLLLVLLFVRLRKSRRQRKAPLDLLEDPENVAVDPFVSPLDSVDSIESQPPGESEKALSVRLPLTPEQLQDAIDRMQEMYVILRQMQHREVTAGASERVAELQRQIQDLMADNAMLSGENPPEYASDSSNIYPA